MGVLLVTIAAFLVDFFAGGGILFAGRLYTGYVFVFFLMRAGRPEAAFAASILYGLLLDVLNPVLPFGTMLLAHVVFWGALFVFRFSIGHMNAKRSLVVMFGMLVGYGFATAYAAQLAAAVFAGIQSSVTQQTLWAILKSSVLTVGVVSVAVVATHSVRARARKLFFIK